MASSLKNPDLSAAKDEKRHRWTYGRDDALLQLARKAVAARPEWRQWRAGRKETLVKLRTLIPLYKEDNEEVELMILTAALTYIATIVREGEYCREHEVKGAPDWDRYSQVCQELPELFDYGMNLDDHSASSYLTGTVYWLLLNCCTPNTVREFMEDRTIEECAGGFNDFVRYCAAKARADALAALADVEDQEA